MNAITMTAAQRERYREMGRKGGKARAAMPGFREHQRHAGRCSAAANDMAALGHLGARAFIEKYGYARLYQLCRNWRIGHPSRHERAVMRMLDDLGVRYEREAEVLGESKFISVDFYLPDTHRVIEVYGRVHFDPLFDHPRHVETRQANDARRVSRLEEAGFKVLVIDYRDLTNEEAVRQRVVEFTGSGYWYQINAGVVTRPAGKVAMR